MSNRVVAIKVLGLGENTSVDPAVFLTREHPLYSNTLAGTVVSLTDQLSSEIPVFGALGSDSTTSFTVLSTVDTRRILMSRGKKELYDNNRHQPVRITGYIKPVAGPVVIPVMDPSLFTVDGYYRIQNTVFKITSNSPDLVGVRVWGSANVPIGMTLQGVGNQPLGCKVYDLNGTNPLGGCEQLPVQIETLEIDGFQSEVIFRGYISKVTNDTSNGQQNLIKVDCSSMMAYIKQAPFIPAWGPVTSDTTRRAGLVYQSGENNTLIQAILKTPWQPEVFGPRWDPLSPEDGATRVGLWQVRQEGKGGISTPLPNYDSPGYVTIRNDVYLDFGGGITADNASYLMCFRDGFYDTGGYGPSIDFAIRTSRHRRYEDLSDANGTNSNNWYSDAQLQSPTIKGENCFESYDLASAIIDLLLGTYDTDLTMASGARSVTESAWLPFPIASFGDLIDVPSLNAVTAGLWMPDVVNFLPELSVTPNTQLRTILPYMHSSVKTVGDVLEEILKRLGAYMVYDKGKFYFGSWAGTRQSPLFISDAALSDPSIKLTFDKGTCLMAVRAKYCIEIYHDDVTSFEVPYINVDLASAGLGKEMTVGHWQAGHANPDNSYWADSQMMANAFGLLMRYSQSAARIDVSLRDSVADLQVGQQVACTFDHVVNSSGEMGIVAALGYVLKASRSWKTPTTAYTIILPGYLSPVTNVAVWSCSALVVDVPGGDDIQVEVNEFTLPSILAPEGTPTSDVEAFLYTYQRYGSWYQVQLLDQYGTLKYQGALTGVNLSTNKMTLPGFDAYAVPGDIIILELAGQFSPQIGVLWDAFLADNTAKVYGSNAFARKWVS